MGLLPKKKPTCPWGYRVEPWSEEEVEKAHALRDAQYERDEIVFDFPASHAFSYHGSVGMKKQRQKKPTPHVCQAYLRIFRLMILSLFGWISQESIRPVEVALIRLQPILARY